MISTLVLVGLVILLIMGLDFGTLRDQRHVRHRWIYGLLVSVGLGMTVLYLSVFDLQSPIELMDTWVQPITRWLIPW
ncbi:hypothetical protein JZ785_03105 [Alicyclobacillus curvatus]|nr:hypothetical protein JZ785_03105 [Alicyclobacillus curvatus]